MAVNVGKTKALVVNTVWSPLVASVRIETRGGDAPGQWYYGTGGVYVPNRVVTPIVLTAVIEVTAADTEGSWVPGHRVRWYVREEGAAEQEVTATTDGEGAYTGDEPVYVWQGADGDGIGQGDLVVKRNTVPGKPLTVRCEVEYDDDRRVETLEAEAAVVLTSQAVAEENFTLDVATEATVRYRPFSDGSSLKTLRAVVRKGGADVTAGYTVTDAADPGNPKSYVPKVFWYGWDPATEEEELLGGENTSSTGYVSGQGTAELVMDMEYCPLMTVIARLADRQDAAEPNLPVAVTRTLAWELPDIGNDIHCTSGAAVRAADETKDFRALLKADGQDMDEELAAKYVVPEWTLKRNDSDEVAVIGYGMEATAPAEDLRCSGGVNAVVGTVIQVAEAWRAVAAEGKVVAAGGKVLVSRKY